MKRREVFRWLAALTLTAPGAGRAAPNAPEIHVFKSRSCGCCAAWIGHIREAGFAVTVVDVHSPATERSRLGMPEQYGSCHTAVVAGYVIEGHVPATDIARLLAARPKAIGLAVPGMPLSSPGMEIPGRHDTYQVLLIYSAGRSNVFASHSG